MTSDIKDDQSRFIVETAKNPGLDVSDELFRTYTFPRGETVRVDEPQTLWVKLSKETGQHSHRIAKANGNGVYIRAGWLTIEWQNKPGKGPVAW